MIRWAASKPEYVLGYSDECWWSRLKEPHMHAWSTAEQPLRLVEKQVEKGEPKALACYGLWVPDPAQMLLRFVDGRPTSEVTVAYLEWVSTELCQAGRRALFLVWDNASWHVSQRVRTWLRDHNQQVKQGKKEGVRLIVCQLPSRAPWLNPIEPKWLHGKRAVAEPGQVLAADELRKRVYAHFSCQAQPLLSTEVS
jgi:hypothetical protein